MLLRNLLRDGRLLRLHLQIPDRPGVLADIAGKIGSSGGNIIEVSHQRLFAAASVQAAELEVMVEARDPAHADAIVAALETDLRGPAHLRPPTGRGEVRPPDHLP